MECHRNIGHYSHEELAPVLKTRVVKNGEWV